MAWRGNLTAEILEEFADAAWTSYRAESEAIHEQRRAEWIEKRREKDRDLYRRIKASAVRWEDYKAKRRVKQARWLAEVRADPERAADLRRRQAENARRYRQRRKG